MRPHALVRQLAQELPDRLERLRTVRGLNDRHVSEGTGVSKATVRKIRRRDHSPSLDVFILLLTFVDEKERSL